MASFVKVTRVEGNPARKFDAWVNLDCVGALNLYGDKGMTRLEMTYLSSGGEKGSPTVIWITDTPEQLMAKLSQPT